MDWSSVPPTLTVFATIAIAFAGGVWALIEWGFGSVTDRFDDQNYRMDGIVDLVNVRFDDQNGRLDARFDAVDTRFDAVDHRFEGLDKRVGGIDRRIDEMRVDLRAIVTRVDALQASTAIS